MKNFLDKKLQKTAFFMVYDRNKISGEIILDDKLTQWLEKNKPEILQFKKEVFDEFYLFLNYINSHGIFDKIINNYGDDKIFHLFSIFQETGSYSAIYYYWQELINMNIKQAVKYYKKLKKIEELTNEKK